MAQDETGLHLSRTKIPDRPMGFLGAGKKDDTRSRMNPLRSYNLGGKALEATSEAKPERDARERLDARLRGRPRIILPRASRNSPPYGDLSNQGDQQTA